MKHTTPAIALSLALLSAAAAGSQPFASVSTHPSAPSEPSATTAAVRSLAFYSDRTRVSQIYVNGVNILTGGGIYLIGSRTGADDENNFTTVLSDGNRMTKGGPPFKLSFWVKREGVLGFKAELGPVAFPIKTMSMPFDFEKSLVTAFSFEGTRYYLNGSGTAVNYTSGSWVPHSSIPQPHPIFDHATLLGYTGLAATRTTTSTGSVNGSVARVRVNVIRTSHYRSMAFFDHFATNNLELQFGSFATGERASAEGEIIVTEPQASGSWTFEAESHLSHQTGRAEADGWSARVSDRSNRYLCYGPYTTSIGPGNRTATFRLLLDNVTADNNRVLSLDVYDANSGRVLAKRDLTRRQFTRAGQYQGFDLAFSAAAGQRLEFRTYYHGGSYVRQDHVTVR